MKTINRYNYEEFFLLYVDNELSVQEKEAVEKFVHQNSDLSVELDMLMQSKCAPEEIAFNNKENLIRTEGNSINETNYEEYFLLYIDNELSAIKRKDVEMYILQHPKLQGDFTSLQQAVLEPEIISYSNKENLYRTEKRRVVYLRPWRLAVAAVFIGLCAIGWWLLQRPVIGDHIADIPKTDNLPKQNIKPVKKDTIQEYNNQAGIASQQTSPPVSDQAATVKNKKSAEEKNLNNVAKANTSSRDVQPAINKTEENNIVKQNDEPVIHNNDVVANADQLTKKGNAEPISQDVSTNTEENNSNYNVYPVAYKELNTNDDDRSVHVAMLELNKDKVKGLLRKAGRLFNNKSNDLANEDGKLQVANFEIETNKQ